MPGYRYKFVLVEDSAPLPVLYCRPGCRPGRRPGRRRDGGAPGTFTRLAMDPLAAIIDAFLTLGRRGVGESAWAVPLADNPLGFLLDSLGDAVIVREAGGMLLYRNRAAQDIAPVERPPVPAETVRLGERTYERRCLVVDRPEGRFVLEVMHHVSGAGEPT